MPFSSFLKAFKGLSKARDRPWKAFLKAGCFFYKPFKCLSMTSKRRSTSLKCLSTPFYRPLNGIQKTLERPWKGLGDALERCVKALQGPFKGILKAFKRPCKGLLKGIWHKEHEHKQHCHYQPAGPLLIFCITGWVWGLWSRGELLL